MEKKQTAGQVDPIQGLFLRSVGSPAQPERVRHIYSMSASEHLEIYEYSYDAIPIPGKNLRAQKIMN